MKQILGLNTRALHRARMSRDPRFDGKFFIAITSTGIYCRPICPSPHAKQKHVRYFPSAAAAAEAGYRPCIRCRPEAAPGTPAWLGTSAVVRRALRLIDEGFLDQHSIENLAERLGIGSRHLHRLFTQHVGAAPVTMAQTRRLHFAKRLLDDTQLPITDVAFAAGFNSIRRFNSVFQETFRRTPRDLRRQSRAGTSSQDDEVVLRLAFRPPYDWIQIRDFLAARAVSGVEHVDELRYSRTVATANGHAVIWIRPLPNEDMLELRVRGTEPSELLQISSAARRTFDLTADPERISASFQADPLLHPLVKRHPGLRIAGAWNAFECVVCAVLEQQVTIKTSRVTLARLVARFGRPVSASDNRLTHLFPTPSQIAAANLDGLGIDERRISSLKALARAVTEGELNFEESLETVCQTLTAIPGISEWTAQYVALRALGEPDAFPISDPVLRRIAAGDGTLLSASALRTKAQAWRPWRGYAAMYLWSA